MSFQSKRRPELFPSGSPPLWGMRVKKEETYFHLLDQWVGDQTKVYNLGIYSITRSTVLRNFEHNILQAKPAIGILCIGNNDFSYSLNRQNTIIDPNFPLSVTKVLYKFRIYKLYKLLMDRNNEKIYSSEAQDDFGQAYPVPTGTYRSIRKMPWIVFVNMPRNSYFLTWRK